MNKDKAAVLDVLTQLYAAWTDNDADAFAELYREDATVVLPGVFHQGKAAVRDYMAAAFASPFKGSRGIDDPQDIRIFGNTAIIVSRAGILMAGEQELPTDRERIATWVLSKQDGQHDGQWRIAAYANAPAH